MSIEKNKGDLKMKKMNIWKSISGQYYAQPTDWLPGFGGFDLVMTLTYDENDKIDWFEFCYKLQRDRG